MPFEGQPDCTKVLSHENYIVGMAITIKIRKSPMDLVIEKKITGI